MSITSLSDWGAVELAAQTHELNQVETPKVPKPDPKAGCDRCGVNDREPGMRYCKQCALGDTPTPMQQLAWATTHCATLQAKVHRMQRQAMEAHMYLSIGAVDRAAQAINQVILDL